MIRIIFCLALIIAFIPVDKEQLDAEQRVVSTRETISLVQSAYYDISQFCYRNPQPCDTGLELFSQFRAKAKTGALLAYSYFDEHFSAPDVSASPGDQAIQSEPLTDPVVTGSSRHP